MNDACSAWAIAWELVASAVVDPHDDPPRAVERGEVRSRRVPAVSPALFHPGDAIPGNYGACGENLSPGPVIAPREREGTYGQVATPASPARNHSP